ncbi:hypothetical protein GCK72_025064 [Caenorhabditis remanei]|uniref:Uncharacterized protein n=1 Tax=Caenorhabditis remanei TaxID=31234 RepID=A0A6A5G0X0_CAERE|nr:hypothetical protein GCK72_025064 [Caenorhabditis remanei]KAF1748597.1 hypothetical protein GCK72_025064 [Caenorhabditis remanei]
MCDEWVAVCEQFDQNHTERPPINGSCVSSSFMDFWGHVGQRSTNSTSGCSRSHSPFGETEITDFNMSFETEEHVSFFQVSVGDVFGVDVLNAQEKLSHVELYMFRSQRDLFGEGTEVIFTHKIHNEVDALLGVEGGEQLHNMNAIQLFHDLLLVKNELHIFFASDSDFFLHFHGNVGLCLGTLSKVDLYNKNTFVRVVI